MKKFIAKAVTGIYSYCILFLLAFGIATGNKALVSITAMAYWVGISLGFVAGIFILLISNAMDHAPDEVTKQKIAGIALEAVKRKSKFMRFIDWVYLIAVAVLLAYSGWVFTGVCYVLVTLMVRFFLSVVRNNVSEQKNAEVGDV